MGLTSPYACVDHHNSLRIIPAGKTREEVFCPDCRYWQDGCRQVGCLLLPTDITPRQATKIARAAAKQRNDRVRRSRRKDLKANCWNCQAIRQKGVGYICAYELKPVPESARKMQRRRACERFGWRETITPEYK